MNSLELNNKVPSSYLFQVEIMVNAPTNGDALEKLLHVLNAGNFADYRIKSGIELGKAIEASLQNTSPPQPQKLVPPPPDKAKITAALAKAKAAMMKTPTTSESPSKKQTDSNAALSDELQQRIRSYIDTNKLIRLIVNKGRGVKLSIPCRIVGFDPDLQLLTVYHVDEKQVHSLKLFEIDDFIE